MAACDPFYFHGITPQVFNTVSKQLADKGFPIAGSSGVVHGPYGIVIEYNWNEMAQTLSIEIVEKSFFVTCNQIREQLANALGKYA